MNFSPALVAHGLYPPRSGPPYLGEVRKGTLVFTRNDMRTKGFTLLNRDFGSILFWTLKKKPGVGKPLKAIDKRGLIDYDTERFLRNQLKKRYE